ncbi:MAG: hypothetical protein ACRCVT_16330 [Leadbetterella sp.]
MSVEKKSDKKVLAEKIQEALKKVAPETSKKAVDKIIKKASKSLSDEIFSIRKEEEKKKLKADKKLAKEAFKTAVLSYAKANAPAATAKTEKK